MDIVLEESYVILRKVTLRTVMKMVYKKMAKTSFTFCQV